MEVPWYLSRSFVLVALAFLGPLGLPFLWWSRRFNLFFKIFLTAAVVLLTVAAILAFPRLKHDFEIARQAFPELEPYIPGFLK